MDAHRLTSDEIHILLDALRIAAEDGSIFGRSGDNRDKMTKLNADIDSATRKLRDLLRLCAEG